MTDKQAVQEALEEAARIRTWSDRSLREKHIVVLADALEAQIAGQEMEWLLSLWFKQWLHEEDHAPLDSMTETDVLCFIAWLKSNYFANRLKHVDAQTKAIAITGLPENAVKALESARMSEELNYLDGLMDDAQGEK